MTRSNVIVRQYPINIAQQRLVHRSKTCRQTIKHSDNVSRKVKITERNGYIFTKKPPSFLFFTYTDIGHIIPSTSPLDT